MDLEEMIAISPGFEKVTPDLIFKIACKITGHDCFDFDKTWYENGLDELEVIELIMEIEKVLNIAIVDTVAIEFIQNGAKPPKFTQYYRDKKIEELGI